MAFKKPKKNEKPVVKTARIKKPRLDVNKIPKNPLEELQNEIRERTSLETKNGKTTKQAIAEKLKYAEDYKNVSNAIKEEEGIKENIKQGVVTPVMNQLQRFQARYRNWKK